MSAKSERPKNRVIKLVGGGTRRTRSSSTPGTKGGSLKAQRRALRQSLKRDKTGKAKRLSVSERQAIKSRLAELLRQKDRR